MYFIRIRQPGQWLFRGFRLNKIMVNKPLDRMLIEHPNGSVTEIPRLAECEVRYDKKLADHFKQLSQ